MSAVSLDFGELVRRYVSATGQANRATAEGLPLLSQDALQAAVRGFKEEARTSMRAALNPSETAVLGRLMSGVRQNEALSTFFFPFNPFSNDPAYDERFFPAGSVSLGEDPQNRLRSIAAAPSSSGESLGQAAELIPEALDWAVAQHVGAGNFLGTQLDKFLREDPARGLEVLAKVLPYLSGEAYEGALGIVECLNHPKAPELYRLLTGRTPVPYFSLNGRVIHDRHGRPFSLEVVRNAQNHIGVLVRSPEPLSGPLQWHVARFSHEFGECWDDSDTAGYLSFYVKDGAPERSREVLSLTTTEFPAPFTGTGLFRSALRVFTDLLPSASVVQIRAIVHRETSHALRKGAGFSGSVFARAFESVGFEVAGLCHAAVPSTSEVQPSVVLVKGSTTDRLRREASLRWGYSATNGVAKVLLAQKGHLTRVDLPSEVASPLRESGITLLGLIDDQRFEAALAISDSPDFAAAMLEWPGHFFPSRDPRAHPSAIILTARQYEVLKQLPPAERERWGRHVQVRARYPDHHLDAYLRWAPVSPKLNVSSDPEIIRARVLAPALQGLKETVGSASWQHAVSTLAELAWVPVEHFAEIVPPLLSSRGRFWSDRSYRILAGFAATASGAQLLDVAIENAASEPSDPSSLTIDLQFLRRAILKTLSDDDLDAISPQITTETPAERATRGTERWETFVRLASGQPASRELAGYWYARAILDEPLDLARQDPVVLDALFDVRNHPERQLKSLLVRFRGRRSSDL